MPKTKSMFLCISDTNVKFSNLWLCISITTGIINKNCPFPT